jgi:hypothetical protein
LLIVVYFGAVKIQATCSAGPLACEISPRSAPVGDELGRDKQEFEMLNPGLPVSSALQPCVETGVPLGSVHE